MIVRPAASTDAGFLFAAANDPVTRSHSLSTEPIAWDAHCAWLARTLADPATTLWIYEEAEPVGSIRFDAEDELAVVSVNVVAAARGRGLGSFIVDNGSRLYVSATDRILIAKIKPDNSASEGAFRRAGYLCVDEGSADRPKVFRLDRSRRHPAVPVEGG